MASAVFSLRFKDARTKEMLQTVAEQTGRSMNDIAEQAVHDQLLLLGAALEEQLSSIVTALRAYRSDRGLEWTATDFAAGEAEVDPLQARQLRVTRSATRQVPPEDGSQPLEAALSAFRSRS